jgi:hypothetical protein
MQELGESRVQYFINEYKNTVFKQKSKPNKDKKKKDAKIGQNALEEKVKKRLETRLLKTSFMIIKKYDLEIMGAIISTQQALL